MTEQPFHDLVAAARRVPEIMGSNPKDARFSEYAYEALFVAADEISAALARIPAEFEERVMDELAPTDQTITMSATGGVYPQPVTTGRRRIVLTTPWEDAE